jgi:hypothetical protein
VIAGNVVNVVAALREVQRGTGGGLGVSAETLGEMVDRSCIDWLSLLPWSHSPEIVGLARRVAIMRWAQRAASSGLVGAWEAERAEAEVDAWLAAHQLPDDSAGLPFPEAT